MQKSSVRLMGLNNQNQTQTNLRHGQCRYKDPSVWGQKGAGKVPPEAQCSDTSNTDRRI